jgi:trimethylamine--corrinoid protein Co-methyltransferase
LNRAIINLDRKALDTIHAHSLEILKTTGIRFHSEKALAVFKKHRFRVDGSMVYFEEKDIQGALETVPAAFTIKARNPSRSIRIGEFNYVIFANWFKPHSV